MRSRFTSSIHRIGIEGSGVIDVESASVSTAKRMAKPSSAPIIAGWLRHPHTRKHGASVLRQLREGPKRASLFHSVTLRCLRRDKHIAIVKGSGEDPLIEGTPAGFEAPSLSERTCGHVQGKNARLRIGSICGKWAPFSDGEGHPRCGVHRAERIAVHEAMRAAGRTAA